MLFVLFQKNNVISFLINLILLENDWDSNFIFKPLWDIGRKIILKTYVQKIFMKGLHNDSIKERFWVYFFNEERLIFLRTQFKLIYSQGKIIQKLFWSNSMLLNNILKRRGID